MFRGLPKTLIATSAVGLEAGSYLVASLCILIFVARYFPQRRASPTRPPKALKGTEVTSLTTGRLLTISNHAPKSPPTLTEIHETRRGKVLSVGKHFLIGPRDFNGMANTPFSCAVERTDRLQRLLLA